MALHRFPPEGGENALNQLAAWVFEDYVICDDAISVAHGAQPVREYRPFEAHWMPTALAQIPEGDTDSLLRFVREFGLLGYERQQLGEWDELGDAYPLKGPEPLSWIWNHARGARLVLELLACLEEADPDAAVDRYIDDLPLVERRVGGSTLCVPQVSVGATIGTWEIPFADQETGERFQPPRLNARSAIAWLLDMELGRLRRITPVTADRFGLPYLRFTAPLQVMYWHLAETAVGKWDVASCKNPKCGRLFLRTHRSTLYCPNPTGGRSRCGTQHRVARLRHRRKATDA